MLLLLLPKKQVAFHELCSRHLQGLDTKPSFLTRKNFDNVQIEDSEIVVVHLIPSPIQNTKAFGRPLAQSGQLLETSVSITTLAQPTLPSLVSST